MPSYNSKNGIWTPAHERAFDPVKDEIYEGPDRAATAQLKELGVEHLGMDPRQDPEMIKVARDRGMTIDEYLEMNKPTDTQLTKQQESQSKTIDHKRTPPKSGVKPQGGVDPSFTSGGFGTEKYPEKK